MKKTLSVLLVICFLMSVTAAAVNAENGNGKEIAMKKVVAMKTDDGKVIAMKKVVAMRTDDGKIIVIKFG